MSAVDAAKARWRARQGRVQNVPEQPMPPEPDEDAEYLRWLLVRAEVRKLLREVADDADRELT